MRQVFSVVIIFCMVFTIFAGCADTVQNGNIRVVLLNFRGPTYLTLPPEAYAKHLFDDTGTYRETPGGIPTAGSVREWFLNQSKGKFSLKGEVLGPFVADDLWADIAARNAAYVQSANEPVRRGEWWVTAARRNAEQALRRHHIPVTAEDSLLIIQNASHEGWTAGNSVVVSGTRDGNADIVPIGILTHELGHYFLRQPDRYTFTWGSLRQWDNMADNYDDFPAGYTGEGRVVAGWAQWGDYVAERDAEINVPPLPTFENIPRYRARLDRHGPVAANEPGYFSLEHRRHEGAELNSALPAEGLTLLESDPQEMVAAPLSVSRTAFPNVNYGHVSAHREFRDYINGLSDYTTWALPNNLNGSLRNGFQCNDGTSLNVLGECLWEFRNITAVSSSTGGAQPPQTTMRTEALWKVRPLAALNTTLEPSTVGRRLYFTTSRPFTLRLTGAGYGLRRNLYGRALSQSTQYVLDLDALKLGGTLEFLGISLNEIHDASIVQRSLSLPYHLTTYEQASLRNGQVWLSTQGLVGAESEGSSAEFLLPRYRSPQGAADIRFGIVRLVLAFANDRGPAPTAEGLYENITVEFCPLGRTTTVVPCLESFRGRIDGRRQEPLVLMLPFWLLDLPGEGVPQATMRVVRGAAASQSDLAVLSASAELDRTGAGRQIDSSQLMEIGSIWHELPGVIAGAFQPPPASACTMSVVLKGQFRN